MKKEMYKFFAKYLFFLNEAKFILQSVKYFKQNYILVHRRQKIYTENLNTLKIEALHFEANKPSFELKSLSYTN